MKGPRPSLWQRCRHSLEPAWLLSEAQRIWSKNLRRARRIDGRQITLEPSLGEARDCRGKVLFSYILDPFLLAPEAGDEAKIPYSHTHFWESWTMARIYAALGYQVDTISWVNQDFEIREDYDLVIDVRLSLERWAPELPASCLKVLHIDTAHFTFHNPAQQARLDALAERRGRRVSAQKMLPPNRAIEAADVATVLGNRFTQETYAFAGKPLLRIPISVPYEYPWQNRDFEACRRRFLWFGSGGLVHKGLDLVLEAFAGMPELELVVCGPVRREKDFEREYFRELYRTPNIHTEGWIDVQAETFLPVVGRCLGLIYPSCSEGGGGSVFTCMHAGLVPIINREVSIDLEPSYGVLLEDVSVEGIREAARTFANRPVGELRERSRQAWEYARRHHTRDTFRAGYEEVARTLLDGSWKEVAPPEPPTNPTSDPAIGHRSWTAK